MEQELQAFFVEAAVAAKIALLLWLLSDAPVGSPEEVALRAASTTADEALDRAILAFQSTRAA